LNKILIKVLTVTLGVFLLLSGNGFAQTNTAKGRDTASGPRYKLDDTRFPYQTTQDPSGLNFKLPSNINRTVEYDPIQDEYVFKEQAGKLEYREPFSMSPKEYKEYELKTSKKNYWNERRKNDKGEFRSSFIPKLNFGGEAFDRIFGSSTISIVPQGSAELIFALKTNVTNNPNISERLRKTTTFDFQEQINMNVTGSIGDKMKVGINYNTEATFEFENKTKLEYTGKEDEIIKKIEAGNVSLPLEGSLIQGSQSLFGLKTELQFGKLTVTTVISQQKGQSSVIQVKGGAQVSEFDIPIDQYDANKHFFLAQFFRNNYESSMSRLPAIVSGVTITKIEVWVTNKSSAYLDTRNIVAFMDLGEAKPYSKSVSVLKSNQNNPSNDINTVYNWSSDVRLIQNVATNLAKHADIVSGRDYEKIESARKLTEREFIYHPKLGYISLNQALNSDEVLAVAFEYTYNGKTYKVGEISTTNTNAKEALVLKLLKSSTTNTAFPTWNLMMKNIYSINAYQVNKDKFEMNVVYLDDKHGTAVNYIPEDATSRTTLLNIENLDNLNTHLDPSADGVFDFIDGVTINTANGRIIFPTLEPFDTTLRRFLKGKVTEPTIQKYCFPELYNSTQTKARQSAEKNKFRLRGTYQSESGSDISLNATNVPQGSVVVTAGGRKLTENTDYTVDYAMGRVKIINQGLLESQTPISISLESNSLFNFQTKTLVGTHLNYKFSDNFNMGATLINLTERPLTQKVSIGDDPISNTIWGLNGSYTTKSQFITNMLDKLPLLHLKEPSTFTVEGEFAQLIPGHSSAIGKSGTAYIDDFEGSESDIDLKAPQAWYLSSTPQNGNFSEASLSNSLKYGFHRAKLAWYYIDPLFTVPSTSTPSYIKNNTDLRSSQYVRDVYETDIFKNKDVTSATVSKIQVLNLAYYPKERGPYNYDTINVANDGTLANPATRWGGIQRSVPTSDFESANIGFIEFWLMDPFVEASDDLKSKNRNGKLFFDLGNISEDVLKDGRKSFENGLPTGPSDSTKVDTTVWGYVPRTISLVNTFAGTGREYQDVGLDGLGDTQEQTFFSNYLNALKQKVNADAYQKAYKDPSSDDFHYFRGSDYDAAQLGILERYKRYNGTEGNSPTISSSGDTYSATSEPNTEDINSDNTLNENESFYEYHADISPARLKVGTGFVVDSVSDVTKLANGKSSTVNWFQFRIPIADYEKTIGSIQDFKSIRFMRMFLSGFEDSVILRFARLQFVRGEWRKYSSNFRAGGESLSTPEEIDASFDISAVNIEDNASKSPVNYVLPPGVTRQIDPSNAQIAELNEQAMVLKVNDLVNGDARAAYKSVNLDIRQYKRIKMDVHAERMKTAYVADNELNLFIRMGSDYKDNYYEYEIPLKLTPWGSYSNNSDNDRLTVWPDLNHIDIALEDLQITKQKRNSQMATSGSGVSTTTVFSYVIPDEKGTYYVCGNPNLSNIKTIMIGIRHPYNANRTGQTRSIEVWVNELQVSGFNESGGWAANLRTTTRLSDFGTLSVAGSTSKHGFGSIESKVNDRSKEDVYEYDIASNLELGKLFPAKSGVQIPMYVGLSKTFVTPQYDPLDPDIELSAVLKNLKTQRERDSVLSIVRDVTTRKSINFTNVRINKRGGNPHFFDVSNWTANYGYSQTYEHNVTMLSSLQEEYKGGLMYNYTLRPKNIAPFQSVSLFKPKPLALIRDFNFQILPTSIGFRTEITRDYSEIRLRNINNPNFLIVPTVNKDFLWNRYYDYNHDITRNLKFDFTATNVARIDEPAGIVNKDSSSYSEWKKTVWRNIKNGGRTTHYEHSLTLTYNIPINKLPMLDWTSAHATYNASYDWDAAALGVTSLGNTITNQNTTTLNGQLNFSGLYNKVPYFRLLSQPKPPKGQRAKKYKMVKFERERNSFVANQPKGIFHNMGSEEVKLKVIDEKGAEVKGKMDVVTANRVNFTSETDVKNAKVMMEGKVEDKPTLVSIILDNTTRLILSLKSLQVTWTRTQATGFPGYMPSTHLMGMSTDAPTVPFILGWQSDNFANYASDHHWVSKDTSFSSPVVMSYTENINGRATFEPIPSLRIELSETYTYTKNRNWLYKVDGNGGFLMDDNDITYSKTGNFSMTFVAIHSAFEPLKSDDNFASNVFNQFKKNRTVIAKRLGEKMTARFPGNYNSDFSPTNGEPLTDGGKNGYSLTSQQVLIPAFMSAYGNINPDKVTLNRIPSIWNAMPNWRVTYDGLSKLDIFQSFARTINLSHSYRATYNIGNYLSNPTNEMMSDMWSLINTYRDLQNNFIPELDVSSVSISEQFAPLIGIDVAFKNNLTTKFEIRKSRNIALSLSNSMVTSSLTKEVVVGAGYKFTDLVFFITPSTTVKTNSAQKPFTNDLNLTGDLSFRDNKTILYSIADDPQQPAQGQYIVTLKIAADYMLTERFNIRMFYDRIVNTPLVASSYPTANSDIGISLRFSLTQ
jgi:cell surface protein SprA